jgi:hypothetical protein
VRTPITVAATAGTVAGRVAEGDLVGRVPQPADATRESRKFRRADVGELVEQAVELTPTQDQQLTSVGPLDQWGASSAGSRMKYAPLSDRSARKWRSSNVRRRLVLSRPASTTTARSANPTSRSAYFRSRPATTE